MTVRSFEGAKCVGLFWLFDSTDNADHAAAKALCLECPVRRACAAELEDTRQGFGHGFGLPVGTWAGRLVGKKVSATGRSRSLPREHGTSRGYYQHRYRNESPCEVCSTARRVAQVGA